MPVHRTSTRSPQRVWLLCGLGALAGCGPSPAVIAGSVLCVLPIAYVVSLLLVIGLARRWRARVPEADAAWDRPWQALSVFALGLFGVVTAKPGIAALAAWTVTGLAAAGACLLARIGVASRTPALLRWSAALVVLAVALAHALVFVVDAATARSITKASSAVFWFGGRWLGPLVVVALFVEAALRSRDARR